MQVNPEDLSIIIMDNAMPYPGYRCCVTLTHKPTGITVESGEYQSSIKAKVAALNNLRAVLKEKYSSEEDHYTCPKCKWPIDNSAHIYGCELYEKLGNTKYTWDEWYEYKNETDDERRERFREGNDKLWGEGNWIECKNCLDGRGKPSFHHKDMHS